MINCTEKWDGEGGGGRRKGRGKDFFLWCNIIKAVKKKKKKKAASNRIFMFKPNKCLGQLVQVKLVSTRSGKAHMRSATSLETFPTVAFEEMISIVWLDGVTEDGPFSCQRRP